MPQWKATAGTFSKAVDGAISINFSESGGVNCSNHCTMKGNGCYAEQVEVMKPSVQVSGERKRTQGFAVTCIQIADDINKRLSKGESIPWVRFSSFGSVPNRGLSHLETEAFKYLISAVLATGAPVHFPVETETKRKRFQALCDDVDHGAIVVRVSGQTLAGAMSARRSEHATSVVWSAGKTKRDRVANAKRWANAHRVSHGAVVCPAIVSTVERKAHKVKCGECKACSQSGHLVIYPQH